MMIFVKKEQLTKFPPGRTACLLVGLLILLLSWPPAAQVQGKTGASDRSRSEGPRAGTDNRANAKSFRLREGTRIENRLGRFEQKSQSATFRTEDGLEFGSLPNLNLQRILETLKTADRPETMWWSVSGTVTEFAGKNHLLISRAVYKATHDPPANRPPAP